MVEELEVKVEEARAKGVEDSTADKRAAESKGGNKVARQHGGKTPRRRRERKSSSEEEEEEDEAAVEEEEEVVERPKRKSTGKTPVRSSKKQESSEEEEEEEQAGKKSGGGARRKEEVQVKLYILYLLLQFTYNPSCVLVGIYRFSLRSTLRMTTLFNRQLQFLEEDVLGGGGSSIGKALHADIVAVHKYPT